MGWYLFILAMVGMLVILAASSKKRVRIEKLTFPVACILILVFMAFRAETVGADTRGYIGMFKNIEHTVPEGLTRSNVYTGEFIMSVENGYLLYNRLLKMLVSSQPQTITIVNSLIIMAILYSIIRRNSPDPMLSIWLYITLGIFQTQMNMARNAIAIMICFLGMRFLIKRQPVRYILTVLLASGFHFTVILFIPLYWLVNIKFSYKRLALGIGIILIAGIASAALKRYLIPFIPVRYVGYIGEETTDFNGFILGIFYLLLLVYIVFMLDKNRRLETLNGHIAGTWMAMLNIAFFLLGYSFAFGTRVAALFGPYLVLFIPQLLDSGIIKGKNKKMLVVASVYLICGLQYILRLMINNIGLTVPYAFFGT